MGRRLLGSLVAAVALLAAPAAHGAPGSGPTAVVSLGDSYISGEAGRWQGNSVNPAPGNDGTDRACVPSGAGCEVDKDRVYVGGTDSGCHRSDVAPVLTARLPVDERINLACSGGQTKNVFRAASGGVGKNGEAPQADQLLAVAQAKDVRMVIISVGGNDLGFASIVAACLQAYAAKTGPCRPGQQQALDSRIPKAKADVIKAIDEVRAVMAQAGYGATDYRLALQTYPSVIPRAAEARYPQDTQERTAFGCPFYDEDLTWGRDQAAPGIGGMVKAAAAARNAELLDLADAFQGHEFCSQSTAQATPLGAPARAGSEWGRFLGASTIQQGELQEAFHPNAYGQLALADCLTHLYSAREPGTFACSGAAGRDVNEMSFRRTSTFSAGRVAQSAPALRLSIRRTPASRGRTCFTFRVSSAGVPVRGVTIRFAGRRLRTGLRGAAQTCRRLAPRRYRATASRRGYRTATRSVRGR